MRYISNSGRSFESKPPREPLHEGSVRNDRLQEVKMYHQCSGMGHKDPAQRRIFPSCTPRSKHNMTRNCDRWKQGNTKVNCARDVWENGTNKLSFLSLNCVYKITLSARFQYRFKISDTSEVICILIPWLTVVFLLRGTKSKKDVSKGKS